MAIVDDENLGMYAEESLEHLETIETDLLEIEKGGETIDEDLVNKVFRAAHSIKGGGGFFGLENIKELSHKIENVLDMVRNFQLVPTPELVNVVLKAFDRLGELLRDIINSNEMEIDEHLKALSAIATGSAEAQEKEVVPEQKEPEIKGESQSFKISRAELDQARKGGKDIYLLDFDLIGDIQAHSKTPLDLIKTLTDIGTLLDTTLDVDQVSDLESTSFGSSLPWRVLFASVVEADLLGTMIGLDDSKIILLPKGEESSHGNIELIEKEEDNTHQNTKVEKKQTRSTPTPVAPKAPKAKTTAVAKPDQALVKKEKKSATVVKAQPRPESLRVPVPVLDKLMNRAGEMVLARNELLLAISVNNEKAITAAAQRINMVTLELQESIMATRMQPVGTIFNKFNRVVRDMSRDLGKNMVLNITGSEIELDKTIIEGLGDPLTHLVRNSCDHGIEPTDIRLKKGKPEQGTISLKAFHESGQVLIEIEDDGKGLDPNMLAEKAISKRLITPEQAESMSVKQKVNLIMLPGFSTMEKVTEISGRGVGMDVVKTNLDHLGGHVELLSEVDKGTTVRIKLPLTLAIMPSLLIEASDERFAIPQVNVRELLRIPAKEVREKIDKVGGSDVLILRGELIPLLQLNNVMGLSQIYYDQKTGIFRPDRRVNLSDERTIPGPKKELSAQEIEKIKQDERRYKVASDVSIVILQAGAFRFGLVVEKVHDTVEIVVKPLGWHLKNCGIYAGATLLGDGRVALILDVAGLANSAKLSSHDSQLNAGELDKLEDAEFEKGTTHQTLLTFYNGREESFAVPLHLVLRIEQIETSRIKIKGGKKVILYRGGNLPVFALEEVANVEVLEDLETLNVIVFMVAGREVGLLAVPPLDVVEQDIVLDEVTLKQPGISGSTIIDDDTTLLVDIFGFIKILNPDWFEDREQAGNNRVTSAQITASSVDSDTPDKKILLAEDSMFFRTQVKQFIESEGYSVLDFADGQLAWDFLDENPDQISLIVTDLEMPNMDGFELTRKIKTDDRFSDLKVMALTSLAKEKHIQKGEVVGIDDYQIKLDKEKLLQGIYSYLH